MCTTPRSVLHYKIKSFAALIQWSSLQKKPRKIISVVGRQTLVRQSSFGHGNAWEKPVWASQWPESRRKSGSAGPTPGTPGGAAAETGASRGEQPGAGSARPGRAAGAMRSALGTAPAPAPAPAAAGSREASPGSAEGKAAGGRGADRGCWSCTAQGKVSGAGGFVAGNRSPA